MFVSQADTYPPTILLSTILLPAILATWYLLPAVPVAICITPTILWSLKLAQCIPQFSAYSQFTMYFLILDVYLVIRLQNYNFFPIYTNNLQNHQDITPTISVFMLIGLYIKIIVLRLGGQD